MPTTRGGFSETVSLCLVQYETGFLLANTANGNQRGKQMVLTCITKSDSVQCVWGAYMSVAQLALRLLKIVYAAELMK